MEQTTATPTTTIGDARASLALADSSSAAPETPATQAETPAPAATTQAATETPTPDPASTEPPKGEPPTWRWQDILKNTRETVAKETEERIRKEVEQQHQWAKDVAEHERQGLLVWRAAMNGDPQAIAHIKANPQAVSWLKGLVAEQAQPAADPEPEPDLQTADGQLVYSAAKQREWREWNNRQLTTTLRQEFQKELQPIKQEHAQTAQERAAVAYETTTASAIAALEKRDPDFAKHKADVWKVIEADQRLLALALAPETATYALKLAWSDVYRDKVLPAKQSQTEAQVLASLQQRAVAGTSNPATASTTAPASTLGNARAALEHANKVLGAA